MRKNPCFVFWLLFLAVLTSCRSITNTVEPTLVIPTAVAEETAVAVVSPTAAPTATLPPATVTVVPTPPPTATPMQLPLPTETPPTGPRQIAFDPGADSGTVTGFLAAGTEHEYRFTALAGQWAQIIITSTDGEANFALTGLLDNEPYKRLVNEDRQWRGPLYATQEFQLVVKSMRDAEYSLTLTIPADLPPLPEEMTAVLDWTALALQAGRNHGQIESLLVRTGWIEPEIFWEAVDLTGDGMPEVLLSIRDREQMDRFMPPGDFAVLADGRVQYRYFAQYEQFDQAPPRVQTVLDMTGDGLPDAVIGTEFCGAHTCTQEYELISAHFGDIAPLSGSEEPYPRIALSYSDVSFVDETGDGLPDIVLHGGFIGSAGAGPYQRGRTQIWGWDSTAGQLALAETRWDPTNYRFHLIYEANDLFEMGDYFAAMSLYTRAVSDPTLEDGEGLLDGVSTYDASRQFAAFRLMVANSYVNPAHVVANWQEWLVEEYPAASITAAATAYVDNFLVTEDQVAACAAATAVLETSDNPTGPLADLGYALPYLTAETVCPVGAEE